MIGVFQTFHL